MDNKTAPDNVNIPPPYSQYPDGAGSSQPAQNPDYIEHAGNTETTYEAVGNATTVTGLGKYPDPDQTGYNPPPPGYYQPQTGYAGEVGAYAYNLNGQQPTTVYIQAAVQPLANPPPNYLVQSILTFIFCCWIFGLVAIIKSVASDSASKSGRKEEAERESAQARKWNIIALVLGSFIWVAGIVTFAVIIALD